MGYCSLEDIKNIIPAKELINLTNDNPSQSSEIDGSRFEAVSQATDSLINGYLRARYNLPLKTIPLFINDIAQSICAYRLYLRRPHIIPEQITKNYELALKNLSDIRKGNLLLDTPGENPESEIQKPKSVFRTNKTSINRIFNNKVMRAFGVPRQ